MAVSKPDRNRLWRRGSVRDSSLKPNRNSSWSLGKSHGKAVGKVLNVVRLLGGLEKARWQFGSPIESYGASEVPDSSFKAQQKQFAGPREVPWQSCWEGFKAFKKCWKRARWQFRSPIESCGALEVPDT